MSQQLTPAVNDPVDTCKHPENSKFLDEKDGTEVCMDCGLVLYESLPCSDYRGRHPEEDDKGRQLQEDEEELKRLNEKISRFGARISQTEQRIFLLDWADNGHLPLSVVDQTWAWCKQMLRDFEPENIHRRDRVHFTFEEFLSLALYQTLYKQNNPRALSVIARITGVSEKRLWQLSRIFPLPFGINHMKPSNFMPGLYSSLPISYKESIHIGKLADMFAADFAYHPLSLLVIAIFGYLNNRKTEYLQQNVVSEARDNEENAVDLCPVSMRNCTKAELSKLTGVSQGTITKGYKKIIETNPKCSPDLLRFFEFSK